MGKIDIGITANNAGFKRAADETIDYMHRMSSEAKASGSEVSGMFKEVVKQTAAFAGLSLGAAGLKTFATSIVNVRKEMQSLHTSFSVLLGDQAKADAMFGELKDFAVSTPLMLKDLAAGAQTMLGFNIEAEKVIPMLKAIGDISMGDAQRFQSLSLAFSQMSATGKLMGQDLLQMINAGFNPLTEISRKTGKGISELKEEMSAGAISAEMVADAFMSATQEGGKFYGMLEKQGKTLKGQFNALQGAIDDMFNALGEKGEGAISATVGGITELVRNYEKVGQVLEALIITYGSYKAALLIVRAVEMSNAVGIGMTAKSLWASVAATKAATAAQAAFNAVAKANPYVLIVTAVLAAATAVVAFAGSADEAAKAQKRLNKAQEDFAARQKEEAERTKELIGIIQDQSATDNQRMQAYAELGIRCSRLTDKYSMEQIAVMSLTDAYRELNRVQEQDKMEFLVDDTNRKVRVYNDLKRVQSGAQASASAETQAFIKDNGLAGLKLQDVMSMLKGQIDSQKDTVSQYLANSERKQESGLSYQQEARLVYDDWMEAKRTYERLVSSQTATKEEVQKARSEMERFDKEYEELTGSKASSKGRKSGNGSKEKWTEADAREQQLNTEQARIDALEEGSEKTIRQIRLNYAKEKDTVIKEEEELREIRAGGQLTDEDQEYLTQRMNAATERYRQALQERRDAEIRDMNDYLQEYGTAIQKKEAIEKDYMARMSKADTEGKKLKLQAEMEEKLSEVDTNALLEKVDFATVFSNMGILLAEPLNDAIAALEAKISSPEFKKMSVQDQARLSDTLSEAKAQQRNGFEGLNINGVSRAIDSYINATNNLNKATERERQLKEEQERLQRKLNEAVKNGERATVAETEARIESVGAERKAAADETKEAQKKQGKSLREANSSLTAFKETLDNVTQLAQSVASGSLSGIWDALGTNIQNKIGDWFHRLFSGEMFGKLSRTIGSATESAIDTIAAAGEASGNIYGMIVGAILSLADTIGEEGGKKIMMEFTDKVSKVLEDMVSLLFDFEWVFKTNPQMAADLVASIGRGILKGVTMGGWSSESDKDLKKDMEALAVSNEGLKKSIDALADEMSGKSAEEATGILKQQIDYLRQEISGTQGIMERAGAAYDKGFMGIGGKHSSNSKIDSVMGSEDWKRVSDIVGRPIRSASDFWQLSSEEMYRVMRDASDIYSKIKDKADEGFQDAAQYMDDYIDYWKELEDLETSYYDRLTQISFDSLKDNFRSSLLDMDKSAKDFTDDFSDMLMTALLEDFLSQKGGLYDQLAEWRKSWAEAMSDGLTETEKEVLKEQYENIVNAGLEARKDLADATGYGKDSSSANATVGTASSMTEEQGNEICGRLTAIQLQGETRIAQGYQSIGLSQTANMILGSILDLDAARNAYLSDIYERMGLMQQQMAAGLEAIKNNTKNL